ncbi:MAG: hypothetical protein SGPRY_001056 [Prymnesium sp.]
MASPSFLLSPGHLLSSGKANSVDYAFPSVSHFSPSNIRHAFSNAYQSCYSMCKSLSFDLRHLSQDIRVPPLDLRLLSQGVRITTCVVLVGALLQRANLVALPRSFARMLCRSLPGRLRAAVFGRFEPSLSPPLPPPQTRSLMPRPALLLLLGCVPFSHAKKGGKMGGGGGGGGGGADASGYDAHHKVMQLLTPQPRGCDASNGTTVGLTTAARAAPAYCGTKLPKRHQCVCLSFTKGLEFGSALAEAGCKVFSFDPVGGAARTVSSNLAFIPADIGTFDGLVKEGNDTVAALTLNSIISSQQLDRVDILRMTIASARQWKTLKYLVNSGSLDGVLQLSLNMSFCDITMWSEYQIILTLVNNHGFKPFYVVKQPTAEYLQVQEDMLPFGLARSVILESMHTQAQRVDGIVAAAIERYGTETVRALWKCRGAGYEHSLWSDEADSSSADEDQQPLLSPGIQKRPHRNLSRSRDRLLSAAYFGVMAINGGMIGAFGPSLQMLERATGLTEYEVGKFVMQNRVSKLVGTLAWCGYAKLVQDERRLGRMRGKLTHQLMACMLATTALFSLVIGNLASSGTALQFSLICWGFVYGVTDSGVTSLTLWRWAHDDRRRRFDVALLNSGFTVGALITPVLVAASLRYGGGRWTFDVIAAAAVGLCALFPYLPNASVPLSTAEEAEAAAADMLKSVGSPEWRRTSDDSSAEQDSPPARIGSSSRQFSRLAGQQAVDLVRVARQKLGVLGAPTDDVKHQVGATTRLVVIVTAMCTVLAVTTGSEHTLATWLAPFGVNEGALSEQRMAVMSSTFWGVMCVVHFAMLAHAATRIRCAGRIAWTFLSTVVSSSWSMLFFDIAISLISSLLLFWYGAFSASERVQMTPWVITLLNTANTLGETTFPYLVGFAFDRKLHSALGALLASAQVIVFFPISTPTLQLSAFARESDILEARSLAVAMPVNSGARRNRKSCSTLCRCYLFI